MHEVVSAVIRLSCICMYKVATRDANCHAAEIDVFLSFVMSWRILHNVIFFEIDSTS